MQLVVFLLWTVVYRLYFHPLAKYPGPLLARLTPFPGMILLMRGRMPMTVKTWHDKYGPVVRVSPNELSFNSAQAWDDIYGHRPGRPNMHKDPIHVGSVDPIPGVTTLTMADDANHARQRRAMAYSFSQKALEEQEHIIQHYVDLLVNAMRKKAQTGEEFNLVDWLNFTTFDIIGDLAFGEPFGCLRDGKFHDWVSLIFNSVKGGAMEQVTRRFAEAGSPLQNWLVNNFVPKRLKKIRKEHLVRSTEKVRRRMANEKTDHRDFIWYIMRQREKHDLKDDEVVVNGALFIVAGSETTANALSGLMARLLRGQGQRCYKTLVDEIRNRFQKEEDIKAEAVAELKYFQACVEEGLRIHPPVPAGLLRTVPKGGDYIDGNWVAGGVGVSRTIFQ